MEWLNREYYWVIAMLNLPELKGGKYKPAEVEKELIDFWRKNMVNAFEFREEDSRPIFTIDTPPPYSNAAWHMGGAIHYSQIDMIARYKRMAGFNVLFPMGLDRNGLPIEIQTEKKFGIRMQNTPRLEFIIKCRELLDEAGGKILDLCFKLGMSCNSFEWDNVYKTDSEQYRALTQSTFIEMWKHGLVYEDARPNSYDFSLGTTISDAEIEYKEGMHNLYDIIFDIKGESTQITISTTRPELIPAIGVIFYNPMDERYKGYEGKVAVSPIFDKEIPIKEHNSADMAFGSGMMMVSSFGDISDVRIFRELNLTPTYVIGLNGRMNENAGILEGKRVKQARALIVEKLYEEGRIKQAKEVAYRYPVSDRTGIPIEFIGRSEYYLKQVDFVDKLLEYADICEWYPPSSKQIWINWINRVTIDWPISRRRYYGTEVPIWACKDCGEKHVPEPGKYYQPWKDPAPFEKCEKCGCKDFIGDERTFDTWVDSSVSLYYTQLYPMNKENKELYEAIKSRPYVSDFRPQGKDIVRTWLHYSMLRLHHLLDKPGFKQIWISGHVVTEKGEKMSKSKGNATDPVHILQKYGGDALRFFGTLEASHGNDIRFAEERLKGLSKFLTKLKNIAYFISQFGQYDEILEQSQVEYDIQPTDLWIMNEFNQMLEGALEGFENYDFHFPAKMIKAFVQDDFASNYLEMVKGRAYNHDQRFTNGASLAAKRTLYEVLDAVLRCLSPIIPFLTDYLYISLFKESVHKLRMPQKFEVEQPFEDAKELVEVNKLIWKFKHEAGLSLRAKIGTVIMPPVLRPFKEDLQSMHLIEKVHFDPEKVATDMTQLSSEDKKTNIYVIK